MTQTKSDWMQLIHKHSTNLSKGIEKRFLLHLSSTVDKVLASESLKEEQVLERTGEVLNAFFDTIVGTTVGLIAKHANSSPEMEQRVLANVSRWFEGIREMENKNANH